MITVVHMLCAAALFTETPALFGVGPSAVQTQALSIGERGNGITNTFQSTISAILLVGILNCSAKSHLC